MKLTLAILFFCLTLILAGCIESQVIPDLQAAIDTSRAIAARSDEISYRLGREVGICAALKAVVDGQQKGQWRTQEEISALADSISHYYQWRQR